MCDVHHIHMVGSVPLPDGESVFRSLSNELGPWLKRLPDGETGERGRWIYWQREMLIEHPAFELANDIPQMELREWNGRVMRRAPYVRLKADVDSKSVKIETGYAAAAFASYKQFCTLRDDGAIPAGVKFQVCLPTAISSAYQHVAPSSINDFIAIYEPALMGDLQVIVDGIPHHDLSIQWDICQEVLIYEDYQPYAHRPDNYKQLIAEELTRIGNAVPAGVDMGYHLCYGSPADAHLAMPKDMAIMVEMVDSFLPDLNRPLNFLHMPVPQDRTDDAYFAPLKNLKLPEDCEFYLGLIHHNDEQGDKARIEAACRTINTFGISTECGWGRADPQRVPGLVGAHRKIMESLAG